MPPSLDSSKPDYELLFMMYKAGMISQNVVCEALDINREAIFLEDALGANMELVDVDPLYEEKRERILELCRTEGFDMHLHNDIVAELLQYMDGDHPAFGNVVASIYSEVEQTGKTAFVVTIETMRRCQEYRKPERA